VALKVPVEKAGEQPQLEKCDSKRGPLSVFGEQCVSHAGRRHEVVFKKRKNAQEIANRERNAVAGA
jgi:hypothetical protein